MNLYMISQYILPHPYLEKKSPSAFLFPSEFFKKVLGGGGGKE